jgi:predicted enzyme related to lactoylglutathione lyase
MGHQGKFIWYELQTGDPAAARTFYEAVVGWRASDAGGDNQGYTILSAGERGIGGIGGGVEGPSSWTAYVAVADADSAAERIAAAGGKVLHGPADIPDVGRFAIVADPQGALFKLLAPRGGEMAPLERMAPGNVGWHELYTSDWEAGFAFYAGQFGWAKDQAVDMGPMGTYQLFAAEAGGEAIGGMMNAPQAGMPPGWGFYFVVEGIDAAAERVKHAGGQVVMGPMQVPDGSFVIQGRDPQGAMFALVSTTR